MCNYTILNKTYTLKDKIKFKLFPNNWCELPNAPASYKDVIHLNSQTYLNWKDRIRILFTGFIKYESKIVCENVVGATVASIVTTVTFKD